MDLEEINIAGLLDDSESSESSSSVSDSVFSPFFNRNNNDNT